MALTDPTPRPVVVIHGVATRDEAAFGAEVEALAGALGDGVRLIPVYWGSFGRDDSVIDRVLPYPQWSGTDDDSGNDRSGRAAALGPGGVGSEIDGDDDGAGDRDLGEGEEASDRSSRRKIRQRVADVDVTDMLGSLSASWQKRSTDSRRRLIGEFYSLVRRQYLRASAQFTGDLLLYQRRQEELHALVWEAIMRHAPGYGLPERPIDVIAHSLGATMMFDMAVAGRPTLHIDRLLTCASQTSYFLAIGASSLSVESDPEAIVTLPPSIRSWTNFYVPLDPWAFLAAPAFRLATGDAPDDVEVFAGSRTDRIMTHASSHYWAHPVVVRRLRRELALDGEGPDVAS